MSSPKLSVVVCTRNRLEKLRRCVDALLSVNTMRDWELILVDNGSDDGTSAYLDSVKASTIARPQIVTAFEAKRGLAAARNKGWRTATAEIISFTDDDCYVSEEYVDSILQVFEDNAEVGFLGGPILRYDKSDDKVTTNESMDVRHFRPCSFMTAGAVSGANMAFRRAVLERIGGFDERFGAGTDFPCEDVDAQAAALWAGIPGVYDPRPVVYHHHGRKTERDVKELWRSYDKGRGAYYFKYIKRKSSRWAYIKEWIIQVRSEFVVAVKQGRFPTMGQTVRELSSGLRYVISSHSSERAK
jgi:glycosyltransferase involved in cell wall biosynthesis